MDAIKKKAVTGDGASHKSGATGLWNHADLGSPNVVGKEAILKIHLKRGVKGKKTNIVVTAATEIVVF